MQFKREKIVNFASKNRMAHSPCWILRLAETITLFVTATLRIGSKCLVKKC
jgi:hypothetical protein